MVGPVPRSYAGVSKVAGMILDSSFPGHIDLRYVSSGTRGNWCRKLYQGFAGLARVLWALGWRWPDLMHLHVSKGSSIVRKSVFMWLAHLFRVPVILHFHSFLSRARCPDGTWRAPDVYRDAPRWLRWLIVRMLNRAECIVVLSSSYRSSFQTITDNSSLLVLPNPVDCNVFRPDHAPSREQIVLFMGDFSPRKGVRDLIEAIPLVLETDPNARFVLCGSDRGGAISNIIRAAGLEPFVELPGFVAGTEKVQWFQRATVFVLPSYQEGVPIAILEAMAAGLSIVATPVGGIPDVLEEGEQALFLEPGDVESLAVHIRRLLEDGALRQKMGRLNRREAETHHDIPVFMERLAQIFQSVLGQTG